MPPVRHRDSRISSPTNPATARRLARGLSIDISLANDESDSATLLAIDELEIAFAAKEMEISSLLSPLDKLPSPLRCRITPKMPLISHPQFPEIIDSFESFNTMREVFLTYLAQNNLLRIVPESKLYRSVYFPYG